MMVKNRFFGEDAIEDLRPFAERMVENKILIHFGKGKIEIFVIPVAERMIENKSLIHFGKRFLTCLLKLYPKGWLKTKALIHFGCILSSWQLANSKLVKAKPTPNPTATPTPCR